MPKPNDMPLRLTQEENPNPYEALDRLIAEVKHTMRAYLDSGYDLDMAFALTDITIDTHNKEF